MTLALACALAAPSGAAFASGVDGAADADAVAGAGAAGAEAAGEGSGAGGASAGEGADASAFTSSEASASSSSPEVSATKTPEQLLAAAEETRRREEAEQAAEEERQRILADQQALGNLAVSLGAGAALLDEAAVQEARKAAGTELSPEEERLLKQQEAWAERSAKGARTFGYGVAGMAAAYAAIGAALLAKARSKRK